MKATQMIRTIRGDAPEQWCVILLR